MGTGASNISPPASPRHGLLSAPGDLTSEHVIMAHDVAPIVIKGCREEFQRLSKFKEPIVMARIAQNMPEHPLIKGKYFLIADQSETDWGARTPPELPRRVRQADRSLPVYGCSQPSKRQVERIVDRLVAKHKSLLLINTREEAVLFPAATDTTYTIRHVDRLDDLVTLGQSDPDASEREARIRKEIVDHSSLDEVNKFYFYNSLECFDDEPHVLDVTCADDVLVSEEIYTRLSFRFPTFRICRLCFPKHRAPTPDEIDIFLTEVRQSLTLTGEDGKHLPAVLFVSANGEERSTLGMVLASLIYSHLTSFPSHSRKIHEELNERNPRYGLGEYVVVRELVRHLHNGIQLKHQVDAVIDRCSGNRNLRTVVMKAKHDLESCKDPKQRAALRLHCTSLLERYVTFICFNAYLRDQASKKFSISYSRWLQIHPTLLRLICNVDSSERSQQQLLEPDTRILVADNYIGLDVLSSQAHYRVANFRKLMGLPIYGMAQASRDGLSRVVNSLLDKRQGYKHVAVIGLRNDVTVECDGATYNVRDVSNLEEPILVSEVTGSELEAKEETLKTEVQNKKQNEVYEETSDRPVMKDFINVMSPQDLLEQQKLQTLDMSYKRAPMQYDHSSTENEIDRLQSLVEAHYDSVESWKETRVALVFTCRTGKSRTSFAMAVAGLIFYHKCGIPYGSKPAEQERVSCPNAPFTQGEFIIVNKLVRLLPDGQQVKREVDLVLDQVFETMSPMHFHLREVIFVTYNKIKNAKTASQKENLQRLSMDCLERYLLLILYNSYLHHQDPNHWETSFSTWMQTVASRVGAYKLLDSLAFYDFEPICTQFSTRQERWRGRKQNRPFLGQFI